MRRILRPALAAVFCLATAFAACANDPGDEPGGGGGGDGSGDAGDAGGMDTAGDAAPGDASVDAAPDPACEGEIVPFDGDPCDCEGAEVDGTEGLCTRTCLCDGGFWACDETCEEPDPLDLRWTDAPAVEEVDGDGDADVDPGERWAVTGTIAADNAPEGGVRVDLRLDTLSGRVDLTDSVVVLDVVDADGTAFALPFDVDDDASEGSVALDVEAFTEDGLASLSDTVTIDIVGVSRAELRVDVDAPVEIEGDGNRFIDPAERWAVDVTIVNEGNAAAPGVTVAAVSSSASVTVDTATVELGEIGAGGSQMARFELSVAADPADTSATITITSTSTDASVPSATAEVEIDIEALDTLAWDTAGLVVRQAAGGGNGDAIADDGETWEAVLPVTNSGTATITGLSVSVTNFETPSCGVDTDCGASGANRCDDLTPGATTCTTSDDCAPIGVCDIGLCAVGSCTFSCADGDPCLVGTCVEGWCEAPVYRSAGFDLGDAPTSLATGAPGEVVATTLVDADTPSLSRVFFSATSDVRTRPHASAAVDVALPRP